MFDAFVAYHARQRPERYAILSPARNLTFAELDAMVNRFARAVSQIGLDRDGVVAVQFADPVIHWLMLLALSRLGIASACATDGAVSFRISDRAAAAGPGTLPGALPGTLHVTEDWLRSAAAGSPEPLPPARPAAARLGRVVLSSGTTGRPKRIGLSWAMIDANIRSALLAYGFAAGAPWLLEVHVDTLMGFRLAPAAWATGRSVLFRGHVSLEVALARFSPGLVCMVPIQVQRALDRLPRRSRPLPGTRVVVTGGLLSPALSREARLRLSPDVCTVYGASECGAATIADAALLDEHPGAVGYPLPDVTVEVVDGDGRPVPAGSQGEVRIHSDRVVGRYLDPDPQERAFRDGWFYPGDLGRLLGDGLLLVEGRVDDLMNIGGSKLLPSAVEDALDGCPGITEVAAFAAPDESGLDVCWLALVRGAGFEADSVRERLVKGLPWVPSVRLFLTERLPRNAMGKVDRRALAAAVRGKA